MCGTTPSLGDCLSCTTEQAVTKLGSGFTQERGSSDMVPMVLGRGRLVPRTRDILIWVGTLEETESRQQGLGAEEASGLEMGCEAKGPQLSLENVEKVTMFLHL